MVAIAQTFLSQLFLWYIHMLFLEYLNLDFKSVPIQCSKTDIVGVEYILFYGLRAHQRFGFYIWLYANDILFINIACKLE